MTETKELTFDHPFEDNTCCTILVEYKFEKEEPVMYYPDGSGYPGSVSLEILSATVILMNDMEVEEKKPSWISWETIIDKLLLTI
jgi:hypothetical protein